jgi:hypothetical protein
MGISNLQLALERRYKDWLGERNLLEKQIDEIAAAYATLDEKRDRIVRVEQLVQSVETIMAEIAPEWDPAEAKPTQKGRWKAPFEAAAVTRWTLDILREAKEPLRSRTIAEMIMLKNGLSLDDREVLERVRQTADATLRTKVKSGLVESVDTWPVRWRVRTIEEMNKKPS